VVSSMITLKILLQNINTLYLSLSKQRYHFNTKRKTHAAERSFWKRIFEILLLCWKYTWSISHQNVHIWIFTNLEQNFLFKNFPKIFSDLVINVFFFVSWVFFVFVFFLERIYLCSPGCSRTCNPPCLSFPSTEKQRDTTMTSLMQCWRHKNVFPSDWCSTTTDWQEERRKLTPEKIYQNLMNGFYF
jgi:hypothetical protein